MSKKLYKHKDEKSEKSEKSEKLEKLEKPEEQADSVPSVSLWRSPIQARLSGMGLLTSNVVHELGNPLSVMTSTLQYVREALLNSGNQQLLEAVDTTMQSLRQMHDILRNLSELTRTQRPRFEPTDIGAILSQMLGFIYKEAESHKIKIYRQFYENLPDCEVDPTEMRQLVLNLIKNAIEAMPNGGELRVKAYAIKSAGKDSVCIEISDTGHGIRRDKLRLIFRPFYSTKPNGTGLGLPFCRHVVEEHGGKIRVRSKLGQGSTFSVILPIRQEK